MKKTPARSRSAAPAPRDDIDAVVQGLRRIVKALESYSREVEASFGLTGPQLWAVKTLARSGPLAVSRLAEELAVHQTSASLLVSRLEQRRLVRRVRSSRDRRVVLLSLTRQGRQIAARAPEPAQGKLLHGLQQMRPGQVRSIRRAVTSLVQAMEAEGVEATFFFEAP